MKKSSLKSLVLGVVFLTFVASTPILARPAGLTFTVNSTLDEQDAVPGDGVCSSTPSHKCTLRAAIMETNGDVGADTILLPAGTYRLTIPGMDDNPRWGDLDITDDLTIVGTGFMNTIIDGNGSIVGDRVFDIHGAITVNITGVTIERGNAFLDGGGIRNAGTLNLASSSIISNTTVSNGGGLYNSGNLNLSDVTVRANVASDGYGASGGGIYSTGTLTLTNVSVISNTTDVVGGGIYNSGMTTVALSVIDNNGVTLYGGGIENMGTMTVSGSVIRNNATTTGGGGIDNNAALLLAGSYVLGNTSGWRGGGFLNSNGSTVITGTTFFSNTVSTSTGGGGGLAVSRGSVTMSDSSISQNSSTWDGGGAYISYPFSPSLAVIRSTIDHNTASSGGGIWNVGIFTLTNSTVNNNAVTGSGGGLYNFNVATLTNSTVSGNTAHHGGGIHDGATLNLNNVTIFNNFASTYGGGLLSIRLKKPTIPDTTYYGIQNTILAGNTAATDPDCDGDFASQGYNLIQVVTSACYVSGNTTGNLIGVNPKLGALQNNGGSTFTHALLAGSPAIDAGNPSGCVDSVSNPLTTDQRGAHRPLGKFCDIGAFEYVPPVFLPLLLNYSR